MAHRFIDLTVMTGRAKNGESENVGEVGDTQAPEPSQEDLQAGARPRLRSRRREWRRDFTGK